MAPSSSDFDHTQEAPVTNAPPRPTSGILDQDASKEQWMPAAVLKQIPAVSRPKTHTSSPIPFFHILERLKTTKREGWRRFQIDHGESISDHMYRMSLITMFPPPSLASRLDLVRCQKMALVHDMAELLVGDITPVDNVLKTEKSRRESITMDYLCCELLGNVDGGSQGREIRSAWQEYEDSKTDESKFVHDVDKIELLLQMVEYERSQGGGVDLGEFSWVAKNVHLPEVKEWSEQILAERKEFWDGVGKQPSWGPHATTERVAAHEEYYGKPSTNGTH